MWIICGSSVWALCEPRLVSVRFRHNKLYLKWKKLPVLSLEFQARANSFWSSQSRQRRGERGGMRRGIVCTGHDVCLLTFTNYPQLALQMPKHMLSTSVSVSVCAYLLGAILNVHMFKATWHTARLALPSPCSPCQNKYKTCGTYICQTASASESHCMNVWMNEWMSEWMSECQMPFLVSFACCFLGAHA